MSERAGARYCSGCGACLSDEADLGGLAGKLGCPECCELAPPMTFWRGETQASSQRRPLSACRRCGGAWVDRVTFVEIVEQAHERGKQNSLGSRGSERRSTVVARCEVRSGAMGEVRYRRCPACEQLMCRNNFDEVSGVIIDSCRPHGVFFDAGELRAVVDFLASGGRWAKEIRDARRLAETMRVRKSEQSRVGTRGREWAAMTRMRPSTGRITLLSLLSFLFDDR